MSILFCTFVVPNKLSNEPARASANKSRGHGQEKMKIYLVMGKTIDLSIREPFVYHACRSEEGADSDVARMDERDIEDYGELQFLRWVEETELYK